MGKNIFVKAPWGHQEILELNPEYMVKRLFMGEGQCCSLQYHENKTETIFVLDGTLKIEINGDFHSYIAGDCVTILPYQIHRMTGVTDTHYLECSTPHSTDVVRLEDKYGRV